MATSLSLLLACLAFITGTLAAPAALTPTATVESGPIFGVATQAPNSTVTVHKFLGVPYAASPVRFAPAATAKPWTTPFNATVHGPACIQQFPDRTQELLYNNPPPPKGESEDCLSVNVYVPVTDTKNKTVMVWIYGGGLVFGTNAFPYYDGTDFAANQNIILVAINYRTNVFGFPNAPALPLDKRNLGYLDQRFALQWIQRNIAAFGGDPKKVTIFGESAGGASVDSLITTTPNNPPFRAGILQSGQNSFYINPTNAHTSWNALVNYTDCASNPRFENPLACVRSLPASVIKNTIQNRTLFFPPVSDNTTNLRYPEIRRYRGNIAKVPILLGSTADEGSMFALRSGVELPGLLANLSPAVRDALFAAYPIGSPGIPNNVTRLAKIVTEFNFQCPASHVANDSVSTAEKDQPIPAYRYYFNATFANTQILPNLGAYHGSEIPILFGTYPREGSTFQQREMSAFMQTTWANFAKDPSRGPWTLNPKVAVLGEYNGTWRNATLVDAGVLDFRCYLYRQVYEALGSAVPLD